MEWDKEIKRFRDVKHFDEEMHKIRGWGIKLVIGLSPATRKIVRNYVKEGHIVHFRLFEYTKVMMIWVEYKENTDVRT